MHNSHGKKGTKSNQVLTPKISGQVLEVNFECFYFRFSFGKNGCHGDICEEDIRGSDNGGIQKNAARV